MLAPIQLKIDKHLNQDTFFIMSVTLKAFWSNWCCGLLLLVFPLLLWPQSSLTLRVYNILIKQEKKRSTNIKDTRTPIKMYECIRIISTIKCKKKKKPKEQSLKNGIYSLIFQVLQLSSSVLMMVKRLYDWRNFCQKLLLHASKTSKRTLTSTNVVCLIIGPISYISHHQWHHLNQSMFYQIIVTFQVDYDRKNAN